MGCLKKLIKSLILALAIVGFLSIGGKEWVTGLVDKFYHKDEQETVLEKAKKVGDFSKINEEYKLEKATGVMGYNGVLAEHSASGQKMVVVDDNKKQLLTREDIESGNIENKLKQSLGKIKYKAIGLEEFKVVGHGEMTSYGKKVPYVRFRAKITRFPVGEVGGIIAVTTDKNGEDRILVSVNENAKYSQVLSEEFFKNVK